MAGVHFEDLSVGDAWDLGRAVADREELVGFAERYDPQPFHVDASAARDAGFEDVIASGWYTAAVCMRRLADGVLADAATLGALGVDELRWRTPVRPGDELAVRAEVRGTEPWEGSRDAGLVRCGVRAGTDRGEALSMVGLVLFARRD